MRSYYSASASFDDLLNDIFGFNPFDGWDSVPVIPANTRNSLPQAFVSSDNPRNNWFLYDNGTMKIEVSLEGLDKSEIKTWFNKRENRFYIGLKDLKDAEKIEAPKDEKSEKKESKEVSTETKNEPKVIQLKRGFNEARTALERSPLSFFIDPERYAAQPTSISMENGKLTAEFGPVDKTEDEEAIELA